MTGYFNNLSEQLFKKPLQNCTVEEVETMALNYPYFAPLQFLLLKKLDNESEEYRQQYQRSILYFKNPLEFDYFIQNEQYHTEFEVPEIEEVKEEVAIEKVDTNNISPAVLNEEESKEELQPTNDLLVEKEIISEISNEAEIKEDEKEAPAEMAFEPYHTVDYFASQGIKLSQEEATNDRFGKQLKSFTEWLKTMKRVPQMEAVKKAPEPGTEKVLDLAEHSVKNPEVVTEAMAEVWLKQGNMEKAAEVYHKLSLHNPSKRAYFAAKIDNLKKEN